MEKAANSIAPKGRTTVAQGNALGLRKKKIIALKGRSKRKNLLEGVVNRWHAPSAKDFCAIVLQISGRY